MQKKYERLQRQSRYGPKWEEIRHLVYKRDGNRCRACGRSRDEVKKLNAHHVLLLKVSQSNDTRNLVTLCDKCHREIESKALAYLKAGGHKRDVVRLTFRWLIEKRAEREKLLREVDGKFIIPSDN